MSTTHQSGRKVQPLTRMNAEFWRKDSMFARYWRGTGMDELVAQNLPPMPNSISVSRTSLARVRLAMLIATLGATIYLLEGCQTLERHHAIELTSSASSRTPYLVNGKRARVVFGYYLLIPEGRQRLTVLCPTGKIEQIVEVGGEQYLFYDCSDMTMSLW